MEHSDQGKKYPLPEDMYERDCMKKANARVILNALKA